MPESLMPESLIPDSLMPESLDTQSPVPNHIAATTTAGASSAARNTNPESGAWFAALPKEKRAAIQKLHRLDQRWNVVTVLYPLTALVMGYFVVTIQTWPVRVAGYFVIGIAMHAMAILVHEASHVSLSRNRRWDRFVGFLMGVPVVVSVSAYRVLHGFHHRYTRQSGDPDEFLHVTNSKFLQSLLFYIWPLIGTPVYLIHVPMTALTRGKGKDRQDVVVEMLLLAVIWSTLFWMASHYGRWDIVLHCWLLPFVVAGAFGNVRAWSEHAMTDPGSPLNRTRTVTSNKIVSFLMCNLNYHVEHHLCPAIPWYNLPKMHALLKEEYARDGGHIYGSYLRFLWDALRTGVHGVLALPM